jgi:hypothetical protein
VKQASEVEISWDPIPDPELLEHRKLRVSFRTRLPGLGGLPFMERQSEPMLAFADTGSYLSVFPLAVWESISSRRIVVFRAESVPPEFMAYGGHLWGIGSYRNQQGEPVGTIPCRFGFVEISVTDNAGASPPFVVPAALALRDAEEPEDVVQATGRQTPLQPLLGVAWFLDTFRVALNQRQRNGEGGQKPMYDKDPSFVTFEPRQGKWPPTIRELKKRYSEFL